MDRRQFFRRKTSAFSAKSLAALTAAAVAALGPALPAGGSAQRAAAGAAADAVAGGAGGVSAGTSAAAARLVVLSYNVCGGSCPGVLSIADWTSRMERHLTTTDADVILFQEICRGQYDSLRRALQGRYEGRWTGTVGDNQGCGRQWGSGADAGSNRRGFGIATFVKGAGSILQDRTWWLPKQGDDETRALQCVDARRDRTVRVCNTHLDWHADTQQVQAEFVAKLITPWTAHVPVVLGGDLNAEPTEASMALFYDHTGGRGVFQEVDETDKKYFGSICPKTAHRCRSGAGTDGKKKLDYVFLSRRHFGSVAADVVREADVSDHALLQGSGAWRTVAPRADFTWNPPSRAAASAASPATPSAAASAGAATTAGSGSASAAKSGVKSGTTSASASGAKSGTKSGAKSGAKLGTMSESRAGARSGSKARSASTAAAGAVSGTATGAAPASRSARPASGARSGTSGAASGSASGVRSGAGARAGAGAAAGRASAASPGSSPAKSPGSSPAKR